jgi:hypothetical protein
MPIDFDAVAAAFRVPLHEQIHLVNPLFLRLHRQLEALVDKTERQQRAIRVFPLTQWISGALAVTLSPRQVGALAEQRTQPSSVVDQLRAGGRRFIAGIGWIETAAVQELAIPRVLEVVAEPLEAVVRSLERFATPSAELFDPYHRSVSDMFGAIDLGLRGVIDGEPQLRQFLLGAQHLGGAAQLGGQRLSVALRRLFPPSAQAAAGPPSPTPQPQSFPERLRGLGETVLEGVFLIPIASQTLELGIRRAAPMIEEALLIRLASIEQSIGTVRSHLYPVLRSILTQERGALAWLQAIEIVVTIYIRAFTVLADVWLTTVVAGVRTYLSALTAFANEWIRFVRLIQFVLEALMSYDVMAPLSSLPGVPKITLGDIANAATSDPAMAIYRAQIGSALIAAAGVAPTLSLRLRILAAYDVMTLALTPGAMPAETGLFTLPPGGFPDISRTLFSGTRLADLTAALTDFGEQTRALARDSISAGVDALGQIGRAATDAAHRATSHSREQFAELARTAHQDAVDSFAGPAAEVSEELRTRREDPLASAFEQAVARGGLEIVFAAIPTYLGEVRRYWEERRPTPTSPHILARHGRLERVRVPRLTIRAAGRRADAQTAADVAARWRTAVGEAYLAGLEAAAAA